MEFWNHKIYNFNPLVCPKRLGSMRIIALIDDSETINRILNHLGLWNVKHKVPPKAHGPTIEAFIIEDQFYDYGNVFENRMPLRYKFYLLAVHTEMLFRGLYLAIT